jgi:hypothetical protein
MTTFHPRLDILPPPQRTLWPELDPTPDHFTLYGGTALVLRLGHRQSVDFELLEPHDAARDGEQFRCGGQGFHGRLPSRCNSSLMSWCSAASKT